MKLSSTTRLLNTAAVAALLGLVAAPSVAGNYAEGDPRPAPFASSTTRAAVTADAQQWLKTAPTQGYNETMGQEPVVVSASSRAAVAADTQLWMRSGLAAQQSGEAGADMSRPGYREAQAAYTKLREGPAYGALVDQLSGRQAAAPGTTTLR